MVNYKDIESHTHTWSGRRPPFLHVHADRSVQSQKPTPRLHTHHETLLQRHLPEFVFTQNAALDSFKTANLEAVKTRNYCRPHGDNMV